MDSDAIWSVVKLHTKYINLFFKDITPNNLWVQHLYFTNSEALCDIGCSYAMYKELTIIMDKYKLKESDILIHCPGDGDKPYTSATINMYYPNILINSIDPAMKIDEVILPTSNIIMHKSKIEDYIIDHSAYNNKPVDIVISVFSHGDIIDFYKKLNKPKCLIGIQCKCNKHNASDICVDGSIVHNDDNLLTTHNKIVVMEDM